ncbi:MAG TPA: FRG domain-containing protein, partial [Nitrospiraceae bacterium]|nr:FRG domain-containing protein [Nitrospiraceae bacterium]
MEAVELKCWEEFRENISSLFIELDKLSALRKPLKVSTPLFRGQANASWELETTLDRLSRRDFGVEEYFDTIQAVRPAVISITGKDWDIPDEFDGKQRVPQGYEFMVYLRHHGFPSPLLDWTRSPFVAAYFAFRSYDGPKDGKVAIYSFVEYLGGAKSWSESEPSIHGLGPYLVSHRRHYAQQCEYT